MTGSNSSLEINTTSYWGKQVHAFSDPTKLLSFKDSISRPRFTTFLIQAGHDEPKAIELYFWNIRLAGELMFALNIFEVCLRNRLHLFLINRFGARWPYDTRALRQLTADDRRRLIRQIADLQTTRNGVAPSPDAIVSALSLGFWVSLLTRSYSVPFGWHGPGLRLLLPHDPSLAQRDVYRICNEARVLRNRVAHHEPLLNMPVARIRGELDRILGAMCPGSYEFAAAGCRVATTLAQRP